MLTLSIQKSPTDATDLLDRPFQLASLSFSTNEHGFASAEALVSMTVDDSWRLYDRYGIPHVTINDGPTICWEGRLEDVAIVNGGVRLKALGYQRVLSDTLYTWGYATTAASAIVSALITSVSGINPGQLSSSTALVNNSGTIITDNYENARPADILNRLAGIGDTSGNAFEWGVGEGRVLYFRQRGSAGRTWYVDASEIELERSLDKLYNSGYGIYTGDSNQKLTTATVTDADSVARYGITRQAAIGTDYYDATLAGVARDTFIASKSYATPRATMRFASVFDENGGKYPLWNVRSGDTIVVRNLPPTVTTDVDYIRRFRVVTTLYDADNDVLETELSNDIPALDVQVSDSADVRGAVLAPPSNHVVEGGLNVGTATGAATGEVRTSAGLLLDGVTSEALRMRTFTLANLATAQLPLVSGDGAGAAGLVFVVDHNNGGAACYEINGTARSVIEVFDPYGVYTPTAGTASSTNIYWSAANVRYEIENRRGATADYRIMFFVTA